MSNNRGHAANVVEVSKKELLKNNVVDVDREVMEDINLLTDEKSLVLNPFYHEENVSEEEELLESLGLLKIILKFEKKLRKAPVFGYRRQYQRCPWKIMNWKSILKIVL